MTKEDEISRVARNDKRLGTVEKTRRAVGMTGGAFLCCHIEIAGDECINIFTNVPQARQNLLIIERICAIIYAV